MKNAPEPTPRKPIAVISAEEEDDRDEVAADWVAPEDDSRARVVLFRFLPILFLCLIAYWPTWRPGGHFIWQDDVHVTSNNPLRSPVGLGMLWAHPRITPQWAPLGYTLIWPQHFVWSDRTPVGYHIVSLLIHSFNAVMVWMLLKRLEAPGAFLAALIFALHPMQVESVAWIARQPMLWSAGFGLSFLLIYLRWSGVDPTAPNPSRILRFPEGPKKLYTLAILAYLCALLCGPTLVCTLPLVMGLIVWWKQDTIDRKLLLGLFPFVLLSIGAVVAQAIIERPSLGETPWSLSVVNSIVMAARAIGFYAIKFIWPADLTVAPKNWPVSSADLVGWATLIAVLIIAAVLWIRRNVAGKTPFTGVAILLLLLLPVVTPVNRAAMQSSYVAERFQYLACAVMATVVLGLIVRLSRPVLHDVRWPAPVAGSILITVLTLAVLLGHATSFANATALWENAISQDPENVVALVHLAQTKALVKEGESEASNLFQKVLRLTGRKNMDALLGMGHLLEKNDPNEALKYYEEALADAPGRTEPIEEYGAALVKQRRVDEAIALYQKAITRFPNSSVIYRALGKAQMAKGDLDAAIGSLNKSVELNGSDSASHIALATCYFAKRNMDQARAQIDEAAKLDPRNFDLYMSIGEMSALSDDMENAALYYRFAIILKPTAPEPSNNVGFVLTRQAIQYWQRGQPQLARDKIKEGLVYFQRAINLNPDFESAKKNLATAIAIQKQIITRTPPTQPTSQPSLAPAAKQPVGK